MALRVSRKKEALKHLLLWGVLFFSFYPLFLMVITSFKNNQMFQTNPFLPGELNWDLIQYNWTKAWAIVSSYVFNSIFVSVFAVAFCLIIAVLTSYVLARYRFIGRSFIYYGLLAAMFLPGTAATLVTMFNLLKNLGLNNSLLALIIVGAVGGQVVCVFILRQFIQEEIPKELFESAQIDGAGHLQQIRHIVLPMSGSVMATLAIMQFINNWNQLMLPLILLRDDAKLTIPVGLMRLEGEYVIQWGEMMAGYTIASIPLVILFFFTMRLFVKGIAAGAIKG